MRTHTPALVDIARGLSVVQRWNGMTIIPWSVLQHTLLVASLMPVNATVYERLYALLHDAAEMYMGDIPRPYKVPEQYDSEAGIIAEIFEVLGVNLPTLGNKAMVRKADDLAGAAEAEVLVPLAKRKLVRDGQNNTRFEDPIVASATETVWSMRDMSRKAAIDTWLAGVYTLLDEYFLEFD